jgi:hypothetical protein
VDVFLASWCCEGAWLGLSDSFSRPTTLSKPANEKGDEAIFRLVSNIKIQDQPEVVAPQSAAAIVSGAGQKYDIYYSCTAAVNAIMVALLYSYMSSCAGGSSYRTKLWRILLR